VSIFDLFDFAKDIVEELGYLGVFLGTFLEAVFPPIPSEIIMGLAGFLISTGEFQWLPTILAAVAGNVLSVSLIWYLGRTFGRSFIVRWGKWVGINEKEVETGEKLFAKYGYWIVLGCQMLPLARTTIAFPAGVLKTRYLKFILFNTLGASIWLTLLAYVGYTLGENWEQIEEFFKPYERVMLVALAAIALYLLYSWIRHIRRLMKESKATESV
jgi:membrane protein DedA with SNARE-associated domain